MRYWRAIYEDGGIGDFTNGKIYESDDDGYDLVDDVGYVFNYLKPNMFNQCEFEEVTKRDYLFQLGKENKMRKFKVGDKVRIVKNLNGHGFKIGDEVEIIEEDEDDLILTYKCKGEKYTNSLWVNSEEIELIRNRDKFELNISSKDGITSCTYKLNGELKKNKSVKLYYKDTFNVETAVDEVLKKVFAKLPHEIFELKVEKELGHKPSNEELIEAYRKEIK